MPLCSDFVALQVYLIIQKAILNVVRHGAPNQVCVRAADRGSKGHEFWVSDDGEGIAGEKIGDFSFGVGLRSMSARARSCGGNLRIGRSNLRGTEVVLRVPRPGCQRGPSPEGEAPAEPLLSGS